jgi:hypothetical protein
LAWALTSRIRSLCRALENSAQTALICRKARPWAVLRSTWGSKKWMPIPRRCQMSIVVSQALGTVEA